MDLLTLLLQALLATINYSVISNLLTSQITMTCSILVLVLFCTLLSLYSQLNSQSVKVTLGLTVCKSVSLGLGLMTRYLLLFDSYGLVFVERPL
jgi:hypothetical protein